MSLKTILVMHGKLQTDRAAYIPPIECDKNCKSLQCQPLIGWVNSVDGKSGTSLHALEQYLEAPALQGRVVRITLEIEEELVEGEK